MIAKHVGQKFIDGGDIRFTIEKMKKFKIEEPEALETIPTEFQRKVRKRQVAEWARKDAQLKNNISLAYSLVWGLSMQNKLKASPNYVTFEANYDVLGLLEATKACTFQYEHEKDKAYALVNTTKRLYGCYQGRETPLESHHEKFQALLEIIEEYGGEIPVHEALLEEELELYVDHERKTEECIKEATELAKQRLIGMIFLLSCDRTSYGSLIEDPQNDKLKGFDNYPKTINEAYNLLVNYNRGGRKTRVSNNEGDSVSFVNKGHPIDKSNKECYNCHKLGNFFMIRQNSKT